MSRYSAFITTGAGSSTLPIISLYAPANNEVIIREVGVFNTTTTAARLELVRLTSTGTQGGGITVMKFNDDAPAATGTPFTTHTVAPTLGAVIGGLPIGAAIGAGTILTFYGENNGLYVPKGVANGIGLLPIGTGQVADAYVIWDE